MHNVALNMHLCVRTAVALQLRIAVQVHPMAKQQDGGKILTDFPDVFDKLVTRNR